MAKKQYASNSRLVRYLSLGIQLMATVGIGLWAGYWLDKKLSFSVPLLIWILPTVLLVMMLVKLVRAFSKKGKNDDSSEYI